MSDYNKATNFAVKDGYVSGNPNKAVKGTEIDDEFNAISSAISSKADISSPTLTGTPAAPTAVVGTNTTQIATTAFVKTAVETERDAVATVTNKTFTAPYVDSILYEGTDDDYETTLAFVDPTADRTITFPDKSGTVAMTSEIATASSLVSGSGTYAVAGSSTVTVTLTAHGRAVDDVVYLNFTSGTAVDGYFTIASVTTNSFTFNYGSTLTTSGNVTVYYSNVGSVAIASSDEVVAGTSTNRAATPAGVLSAVRASIVQGTSVAATSGTSISFTGIPSWAKKITVMFNNISVNAATPLLVQIGSGSTTTTGYKSYHGFVGGSTGSGSSTAGFIMHLGYDADTGYGIMNIVAYEGYTYVSSYSSGFTNGSQNFGGSGGGGVTLGGVLDRVVITTVSGTATFDSGSINIMYE